MQFYKTIDFSTTSGFSLHALSEVDIFNGGIVLLPIGAVQIEEDEAQLIREQNAPPPLVPQKVTMRQAQETLLEDGTLDLVNATIDAMTGIEGRRAQIQWTKSQDVYRNWPLVIQLGPVIGKTPEQLDQLFMIAATK